MDGTDRQKLFIRKERMMQPKSRKERIEEYGSFLFCPDKETLCFAINNDEGICERALCYLEDPEYIAQQKRIAKTMEENVRREQAEREREKLNPPAPIRRQTKTKEQNLQEQIRIKEEKARYLYRTNKPRAADNLMHEVTRLRGQLLKIKEA